MSPEIAFEIDSRLENAPLVGRAVARICEDDGLPPESDPSCAWSRPSPT